MPPKSNQGTTDRAYLSHPEWVKGACGCGIVQFEIKYPARWAYHDHSNATRKIMGTASVTYVGSWRKRFRVTGGEEALSDYRDDEKGITRRFCIECGSAVAYERDASPHMINTPRGLFKEGVGREPRYHVRMGEMPDWAYTGEKVTPLKDYPTVLYERPRKTKKRAAQDDTF
ncbi:MAG: GFA family protein [Parvibaculaceae bacterium]|nr:GFA family protein [Parvibaculaceae bacterium]